MGNVNMEASQINYRNNSKPSVHTVGDALNGLYAANTSINQDIIDLTAAMTAKADKIDIAPNFSAENTYFVGDLVFQSGRLWKFITNHTEGEWNQEEVEAINIDLAIKAAGGSSLPDYSTTEQATGQKWIDGKQIYFKVVNFGALPNNTSKSVDSGLTNEAILDMKGFANAATVGTSLPTVTSNNRNAQMYYDYTNHKITIMTADDYSDYSAHVVLYYTKTA